MLQTLFELFMPLFPNQLVRVYNTYLEGYCKDFSEIPILVLNMLLLLFKITLSNNSAVSPGERSQGWAMDDSVSESVLHGLLFLKTRRSLSRGSHWGLTSICVHKSGVFGFCRVTNTGNNSWQLGGKDKGHKWVEL